MNKILAIGLNTFREAIRNKVLYSLLGFALLVIVTSLAFGALSVQEEERLTRDLGLGGMSIFLTVIAIFVGVNLVYKELERKTVYTLLPKPIHRFEFVIGKFLGLLITLFVQLIIMSLTLFAVLALIGADIGSPLFKMITLIFVEVIIITAIAVLFSSFSTPFLSGMFTIGIFLLGRSVVDIKIVATKLADPIATPLLRGFAAILPDLRYFYVTGSEIKGEYISINSIMISWSYVSSAVLYGTLYTLVVLLFSIYLFSKRDFI